MSDSDLYNAMKERRKLLQHRHGRPCPQCLQARPKGNAKILLPGDICGYGHRDRRPRIDPEEVRTINAMLGIEIVRYKRKKSDG